MTATPTPNASYSLTLRVKIQNQPGKLGEDHDRDRPGGRRYRGHRYRQRRQGFSDPRHHRQRSEREHDKEITRSVEDIDGVEVVNVSDRTFLMHLGGKIEIASKMPLKTRADLSMAYTPGVARVCEAIHKDPEKVFNLTIKKNTVAVVSDGTAVLGLGDIGPAAAMPVMEGKCQLFKEFGGVDAFPICLNTKDPHEIIETIKNISVAFGGINLEDISAPRCFEIEERLKEELDIPVFHDDQHGTAVVVLAALINALKIVGKADGGHQGRRQRHRCGGRRMFKDRHGRRRQEHYRLRHDRRSLRGPQREHELGQGLVRPQHQSRQVNTARSTTLSRAPMYSLGLSAPGVIDEPTI